MENLLALEGTTKKVPAEKLLWTDNISGGTATVVGALTPGSGPELEVCFEKRGWDLDAEEECYYRYYAWARAQDLVVGQDLVILTKCNCPEDEQEVQVPASVVQDAVNWFGTYCK